MRGLRCVLVLVGKRTNVLNERFGEQLVIWLRPDFAVDLDVVNRFSASAFERGSRKILLVLDSVDLTEEMRVRLASSVGEREQLRRCLQAILQRFFVSEVLSRWRRPSCDPMCASDDRDDALART